MVVVVDGSIGNDADMDIISTDQHPTLNLGPNSGTAETEAGGVGGEVKMWFVP